MTRKREIFATRRSFLQNGTFHDPITVWIRSLFFKRPFRKIVATDIFLKVEACATYYQHLVPFNATFFR